MNAYVRHFNDIDKANLLEVGGKGANLGEMSKAGFPVPPGFCITTSAYRKIVSSDSAMDELLDGLNRLQMDQADEIRKLGEKIRGHLESVTMPDEIQATIIKTWESMGTEQTYAVRSSATAEDLPTASFAGQQETYLNVKGSEQLIEAVQKCWASLFTERAIVYRITNGFDHCAVFLSVVVQQMIIPDVSGIMFTADPVTGHRHTVSIDAGFGLGEALVSGIVTADLYQVRKSRIITRQIAEKKKAIYPLPQGGTVVRRLPNELQGKQALPDDKVLELAALGKKIEKHYGSEQDIEWCLAGDSFYILQSRPITSLYPVPHVDDEQLHVFFSLAHQQMMMEAMRPMAISMFRRIFPFGKDSVASPSPVILEAGGRLFFDATIPLHNKFTRKYFTWNVGTIDELMGDALRRIVESEAFQQQAKASRGSGRQLFKLFKPILALYLKSIPKIINNLVFRDPYTIIKRAYTPLEQVMSQTEAGIMTLSGTERIRKIEESVGSFIFSMTDSIMNVPLGFLVQPIAQRLTKRWLAEELDVDTLNKSLSGNVTSEMGLMIGDLADIARRYPEVLDYLSKAEDSSFYEGLAKVKGGDLFQAELDLFMKRYGMRCAGEIDISNGPLAGSAYYARSLHIEPHGK